MRGGTAELVSGDLFLRRKLGQGKMYFYWSAEHKQDWQPYPVDPYSAESAGYIVNNKEIMSAHPESSSSLTQTQLHPTVSTVVVGLMAVPMCLVGFSWGVVARIGGRGGRAGRVGGLLKKHLNASSSIKEIMCHYRPPSIGPIRVRAYSIHVLGKILKIERTSPLVKNFVDFFARTSLKTFHSYVKLQRRVFTAALLQKSYIILFQAKCIKTINDTNNTKAPLAVLVHKFKLSSEQNACKFVLLFKENSERIKTL